MMRPRQSIHKPMQTCMHTANHTSVNKKCLWDGWTWKTRRKDWKALTHLSGWPPPFAQWLLSRPNLAVVKEVRPALCSQSILCIEKKSNGNQGHRSQPQLNKVACSKEAGPWNVFAEVELRGTNKRNIKFWCCLIWEFGRMAQTMAESLCVCVNLCVRVCVF